MRKVVILVGALATGAFLTGCNPPQQKLVSAACNCHGDVAVTNPDAETPRLAPPGPVEYRSHTAWRAHRTPHHSYRYAYGTRHHGYQGSDDQYERDWNSLRVATSSYDYRSTSRSYRSGGHSHTSGYDDGFVDVPSHYETDDSWRDGYGRGHAASYVGGRALAARMDPWRGYDVDCPDGRSYRR